MSLQILEEHDAQAQAALPTFEELKVKTRQPTEHMCVRCIAEYDAFNTKEKLKNPGHADIFPICTLTRSNEWQIDSKNRDPNFLMTG